MKTKKLSKKLSINKKTIANLHNVDLVRIIGGHVSHEYTCDTSPCDYSCWGTCGPTCGPTCATNCGTCQPQSCVELC